MTPRGSSRSSPTRRRSARRCTGSVGSGCCASKVRCGRGRRARSTPSCRPGRSRSAPATLEVLNEAEPPPFPLAERADDVDEVLRLRHRYLDLRRPQMQRNLRLRATVNAALRTSMAEQGFVEVETPMLIASTPEGRARLRGAVAAAAGGVLRPAAEPAALQAAADGRWHRPLLPDRPLPARRGSARGSPVRVHAVRRGDVVRGPGRRDGGRDRGGRRGDRSRRPDRVPATSRA